MHSPISDQLLHEATAIIELARPLVVAIERRDRDLGNQIRRALNSVVLNVAEGFGCRAGNSRCRFESAHGSIFEARAALSAAVAWQYISPDGVVELSQRLNRLGARLYGLMRHWT
jgi:four helix bundle protein